MIKQMKKHIQLHMHYNPTFECIVRIDVCRQVNAYRNSVTLKCWKVMNLQVVYFFFKVL